VIYEFGLEFNVDYDYDIENLINIVILKINMVNFFYFKISMSKINLIIDQVGLSL